MVKTLKTKLEIRDTILKLRDVDNLTFDMIADRLSIHRSTVFSMYHSSKLKAATVVWDKKSTRPKKVVHNPVLIGQYIKRWFDQRLTNEQIIKHLNVHFPMKKSWTGYGLVKIITALNLRREVTAKRPKKLKDEIIKTVQTELRAMRPDRKSFRQMAAYMDVVHPKADGRPWHPQSISNLMKESK